MIIIILLFRICTPQSDHDILFTSVCTFPRPQSVELAFQDHMESECHQKQYEIQLQAISVCHARVSLQLLLTDKFDTIEGLQIPREI